MNTTWLQHPDFNFSYQFISPELLQLRDHHDCYCFFAIGKSKCLLFDTMTGTAPLLPFLRTFTLLPIIVVLSHAHYDHIGGVVEFEQVYLSPLEQDHFALNVNYWKDIFSPSSTLDSTISPISSHCFTFHPLLEGTYFDLDSLTINAIHLPGHTPGSMGLFIQELNILLSGDAITPIMCLFFPESLSILDYQQTLKKVQSLPITSFMTCHHSRPFLLSELEDFYACAEFSKADSGIKFYHDRIESLTGRLHIFRGDNSNEEDFLGLIEK